MRDSALDAYDGRDLPFERLVEEIAPRRGLSHTPIFQVMFVLQEEPYRPPRWDGLEVRLWEDDRELTKFDLTLEVRRGGADLDTLLTYSAELFDATTAERLLVHLENLLRNLAGEPRRRLSALELWSAAEAFQVTVEWNDTRRPEPWEGGVYELFAARAGEAGDTAAVRGESDTAAVRGEGLVLSYRELERRARRLGRRLAGHGVGPEVRVAVLCERSPELLVGILAVFEAGGAFLLLDPDHPPARLERLLSEAGPAAVVCADPPPGWLNTSPVPVLTVDRRDSGAVPQRPRWTMPEQAAYVLYTSGSGGAPKGVVISHRSLVHYLRVAARRLAVAGVRQLPALSPPSFDASLKQLLLPLVLGRPVWLVPAAARAPAGLVQALGRAAPGGGVGLNVVPSLWQVLLDAFETGDVKLPGLDGLLLGGEAVSAKLVERTAALCVRPFGVWNLYGPSETTANVTWNRLDGRPGELGRPLENLRAYVADRCLRPVPTGGPGELRIAGEGLARGYLDQPGRSAESFVPDPFGTTVLGGRLYSTGDRVRTRPGGRLEFLGRIDRQLKVAGWRIEPREVEAALDAHPAVLESALVVIEGPRLAACVAAPREPPSPDELQRFLAERLPVAMVPAVFVVVDRLARTAHGKLDTAALVERAAAAWAEVRTGEARAAPRTPWEEMVTEIFAELLPAATPGIDDDFFALGGHSLLAMQLTSRLEVAGGIEIPVRAVFEAATPRALAQRLERSAGRSAEPMVRSAAGDSAPTLSFAQKRLWLLHQLDPDSPAYNLPLLVRWQGPLDRVVLEAGLGEVVRRHEPLRTRFTAAGVPVIDPPRPPAVGVADFSGLPVALAVRAARACAAAEAGRPFDLARDRPLRAACLRLGERDHLLFLNLHHIAGDGWSLAILGGELGTLYEAFATRRPSPLPEPEIRYADFAEWQRRRLSGEVSRRSAAFWRHRLEPPPPPLDLPTDRPRTALRRGAGGSLDAYLPAASAAALRELGRRRGTTLFMTLLGGFQALLGRYAGHFGFAVGTPIAGRDHPQAEALVGFFVNTLVLRAELGAQASFEQASFETALAAVREETLEAYANRMLPFERLVEELAPRRDLDRSPFFQVTFALQNAPGAILRVPGVDVEALRVTSGGAKYELSVSMKASTDGLVTSWEYERDLFDRSTVTRLAASFHRLLAAAAAEPRTQLAELPAASAAERAQTLYEWTGTTAPVGDGEEGVVRRFEAWARRAPEALAAAAGERHMSYGGVDRRSGHLARQLRGLGVGPETPVGVHLAGSPELVVALVAVAKAGGVYVPLDPAMPEERLAWMARDAGVVALVVDGSDRLPEELPRLPPFGEAVGGPVVPRFRGGHLAYVLYTSGSTGRPKGVAVPAAGLAHLVRWHAERYRVSPADRALQAASPAFDASLWELWAYLAAGASLHFPTAAQRHDAARFLVRRRITLAFLSTPLAEAALHETWPEHTALRALLTGGDRLRRRPAGHPFALVNHYGPTECTVVATCGAVTPGPDSGGAAVPSIGRAVGGIRTFLVDQRGWPVPVGAIGEIYLGGVGLARGYWKRPARTAESFRPDAFSGVSGSRLYHSGDLARFRADGRLEFAGRRDHQVQLRGQRVELGEIEAVLGSHPGVREAVVEARPSDSGDTVLVAYVVPVGVGAATAHVPLGGSRGAKHAVLRQYLSRRLPRTMVPPFFVSLAELPLTSQGKVDRRRLPAPARAERERADAGGHDPAAELIAAIFAEVLDTEDFGTNDDFFALGGHSLQATRLLARLRTELGVEMPLRSVFEAPTPTALARVAENAATARDSGSGEAGAEPPLEAVPRSGHLPLSHTQERLWFLAQLDPESAAYNITGVVRLAGDLVVPALAAALGRVSERHEVLRTTFHSLAGVPVQRVVPAAAVALPMIDLGGLPASPRRRQSERWRAWEETTPLDPGRGPLVRLRLLRLHTGEHLLLLTLHHLVADGSSLGILIDELAELYEAARHRRAAMLPELPVQYGDFADWQRRRLGEPALERHLAYWRERLGGDPPRLDLPADRPRTAPRGGRAASVTVELTPSLTAQLDELARRSGATLFLVLLAALETWLHRLLGADDVRVGIPVAGRDRPELERLVGLFLHTLVVRGELSRQLSFSELLGRVKRDVLGAHAHREVPFARLLQELAPSRDLSRSPLFQVFFNMFDLPPFERRLDGLDLELLPPRESHAKFDLTLYASRRGGVLTLRLLCDAELFGAARRREMADQLTVLLRQVVADPAAPIGRYTLLTAGARELLADPCEALAEPAHEPVGRSFLAGVERWGEQGAIRQGERILSYGELGVRALAIARRLLSRRLRPKEVVAVCGERCPETMAGFLGVVLVGGVLMPLERRLPATRQQAMLQKAGAGHLLWIGADAVPRWLSESAMTVMKVDVMETLAPTSPAPIADLPRPAPGDPAYVFFTSGTTGTPKGVLGTHKGLAHFLAWQRRSFAIGPGDRVAQLTALGFDVVLRDIFLPLTSGAMLELPTAGAAAAERVLAWIAEREITVLHAVPSLAAWWSAQAQSAQARSESSLAALRLTFFAGEPLTAALVRRWRRHLSASGEIVNLYGPTETTLAKCSYRVAAEPADGVQPIGRPLPQAQALVLSAEGEPCGIGEPGELVLRTPFRSLGYLDPGDDPERRFRPIRCAAT